MLIAEQMGVQNLSAKVDSRLVANQINGSYITKEESMIQYLEKAETIISNFKNFSIEKIPQSENKKADTLSKIASTSFAHLTKQVLVEVLKEKSIEDKEILAVVEEEGYSWMTLLIKYLSDDNGQVESATTHSSRRRVKARLGKRLTKLGQEVPHLLWAHRTMIKTSNGDTPFSLTYGTKSVIPVEIGMPSLRCTKVNQVENDKGLLLNLDILEEKREKAAAREARSKAKMEKYYNAKVRSTTFRPLNFVYTSMRQSTSRKVES
ncbi:reverse transcriptase domain-containing protein [Tanacetum coccineum]